MKLLIKTLIGKLPYIVQLQKQVQKQGVFPAGHYYSPIPDGNDVLAYIDSKRSTSTVKEIPGVDLNEEKQLKLLQEYHQFYHELPFSEKQTKDCRYYYSNEWFSYSDAIFLYSFLRKNEPKRIIEIGSGFSSAVILDTTERFFSFRPKLTFIEPYPERLKSILRASDENNINIIENKVQDAPNGLFSSLDSGDFLFIDSSHVVKCGSDLQFLFFDILPHLPSGIFIHFHDVFYPFDYPSEWLKVGRYWNENYFLRAFLSYNSDWSIYFFNTFANFVFNDFIKDKMPLCTKNPGGSLYIKREENVS